jgi:hypothetical protein
MPQLIQTISNRRVWLLLLPLMLVFTAPYVIRLLTDFFRASGGNNLPPVPGAVLGVVTSPFVAFTLLNTVLLGQPQSYLIISALTLIICLLILLRGRVGRVARAAALLTMGCVLVVPLVFQKTFNFVWLEERGYTVHAVVSQQNFVDATVDGLVDLLDGKACRYDILGWSAENVLYYQADCTFGPDTYWRYDPALLGGAQPITQIVDELVTEPEYLLVDLSAYGPGDHRAPDGRWIASVWLKDDYGPEHVIVVSEGSAVGQ